VANCATLNSPRDITSCRNNEGRGGPVTLYRAKNCSFPYKARLLQGSEVKRTRRKRALTRARARSRELPSSALLPERGIIGIREKIDDIRPRDLTQFFRHPLSTKFIGEIKPPSTPHCPSRPPVRPVSLPARASLALCGRPFREWTIEDEGQHGTNLMRENLVWLTFECLRPRPPGVLLRDTLTVGFTNVGQFHL